MIRKTQLIIAATLVTATLAFAGQAILGGKRVKPIDPVTKKEISKEEARAEGLRIAQEAVAQSREYVKGFQVSAPFGKVEYSMQVLSVLKEFGGEV